MVGMLRLHREEIYSLPDDAKPEEIIHAEMARRTLSVMGSMSPGPFFQDITNFRLHTAGKFVFGREVSSPICIE
jgi:hypothetical protein